jgi:type VI secretion system protein ImpJ
MSRMDKVAWNEGMFLTPQLFQQADRYHESLLHFALAVTAPFPWGLAALQIDAERLVNGDFGLGRASGLMPDGLPIRIPDHDPVPESRSVKPHFSPSVDVIDAYLTIPTVRPQAMNVQLDRNGAPPRAVRYRAELVRASDETTEGNESEIPVARKNFKVLFSDESLDDTVRIKIAEVRRTRTATFELDDSYIPPALTIASSGTLVSALRRLLEVVSAKSHALSQQRRHLADFGASDLANFWLLHAVNSSIPILSHCFDVPGRHPEQLYLALVRLAGELSTFALDADARQLPRYDHLDLRATFGDLERRIRLLLETILPTRYVLIPLERTPQAFYVGAIADERLLKGRFYLGVNAQVPVGRLTEEIPAKTKIGSREQIGSLIGRAVPGVELTHEPVPPSAIPVRPGFKYFQLGTQGRWWEAVATTKGIALYIPEEFPELKLELVAVKEA